MNKTTLLIISVLLSTNCFSQKEVETTIYSFFNANNYNDARSFLDSCIKTQKYEKNGAIWYYRGFAYKKTYTTRENTNKESISRNIALECFKKSMEYDTTKQNIENNKANIKYLATTLYNDAATSLDSINYPISIRNYELYKKYAPIIDTSKNHHQLKENDIKFKFGLAAIYAKKYENNPQHDIMYYNLAKQQYQEILKIESNNKIAKENLKRLNDWKAYIAKKEKEKNLLSLSKYYADSSSIYKTIILVKSEIKKGEKTKYNISEEAINNFGYELLKLDKTEDALKIFTLNTELYPKSANAFDSLGECLLKLNRNEQGLKAYKKSLELNPKNENAKKILSETR